MLLLIFLQDVSGQAWGPSFYAGNIIRHRENLAFDQPKFIFGGEYEYRVAANETSLWQRFWRMPDFTHHFQLASFGNPDQLGYTFAYYPSLSFKMFSIGKSTFRFQAGSGLVWITKPFDKIENTKNNAIGTHLNNITAFTFENKYVIHQRWELELGFQLLHYSNGAAHTPNSGINIGSFKAGVKYRYQPKVGKLAVLSGQFVQYIEEEKASFLSKISTEINIGIGFKQIKPDGGQNFIVPQLSMLLSHRTMQYFHLIAGIRSEYNYARNYFLRSLFFEKSEARRQSFDHEILVGADLIFGKIFARISNTLSMPILNARDDWQLSHRLGLFYKITPRSHIGVSMKSRKFVAEYLSINVGIKI